MKAYSRLLRKYPQLIVLAHGGVALGVAQAFPKVSFADVFTNFISFLLSVIVNTFFGADSNALIFNQLFGGGGA